MPLAARDVGRKPVEIHSSFCRCKNRSIRRRMAKLRLADLSETSLTYATSLQYRVWSNYQRTCLRQILDKFVREDQTRIFLVQRHDVRVEMLYTIRAFTSHQPITAQHFARDL